MKTSSASGSPADDPVFLLSSERSGSTLLRVAMNAHPRICGPSPPHLLGTFPLLIHLYGDLADDGCFRRLATDMLDAVEHQMGRWKSRMTLDELIGKASERSFAALFAALYSHEAAARGKKRYFVKDNGMCQFVFFAHALFPKARFIYLVRDARDVVSSRLRSSVHFGDHRQAAEVWATEQAEALQAYGVLRGRGMIRLVRYEDLIGRPEEVLREVCAFIGEEYHPGMLEFHATGEAQESAAGIEAWKNLTKPFMADNRGRFRERLSRKEVEEIERIAGAEMRLLGYGTECVSSGDSGGEPPGRWSALSLYGAAFRRLIGLLSGTAGRREVGRRVARLHRLKEIEREAKLKALPWSAPPAGPWE